MVNDNRLHRTQLPLLAAPRRQSLPAYDHSVVIGMQYVSLSGEPHNALHSPSIHCNLSVMVTVKAATFLTTSCVLEKYSIVRTYTYTGFHHYVITACPAHLHLANNCTVLFCLSTWPNSTCPNLQYPYMNTIHSQPGDGPGYVGDACKSPG